MKAHIVAAVLLLAVIGAQLALPASARLVSAVQTPSSPEDTCAHVVPSPNASSAQPEAGTPPPSAGNDGAAILREAAQSGVHITAMVESTGFPLPELDGDILYQRIALVQWSLDAGSETRWRETSGPILIWVSRGQLLVGDDEFSTTLQQGDYLLVADSSLFSLFNVGSDDANALLLWLEWFLMPDDPDQISTGGAPQWELYPRDQEPLLTTVLSNTDLHLSPIYMVPAPPRDSREDTLQLFIGCLHWTDPSVAFHVAHNPGRMGVVVLNGSALIDNETVLAAAECLDFPPGATFTIRPEQDTLDLLVYGTVLPLSSPSVHSSFQSARCSGAATTSPDG